MTIPPPPPLPPHQPEYGYVPPPPPAPSRARRGLLIGTVMALLIVAGAATAWWLTRDDESGPLAGRPRVTDTRAGLSYAIPEGWRHSPAKDRDLIDAFTSQITKAGSGEAGSVVFTGRARQVVPEADLRRQTEFAARSNAEFFFPDQRATLEDSRPTTVDGRPAHAVKVRVADGKGGMSHLEMVLVTVNGHRTSFVLGVVTASPGSATGREIDEIVASTTVA
ncbi:hypothetical protein ACWCP6_29780 [Streptomyces sp. NPDC002004]